MDDYDWLSNQQKHWTHWSGSPDTHLNYANEFDINTSIWLIKNPFYWVGPVIGYRQTRFSWTAFGGHYWYNNGRDIGDFKQGERGIGYRQKLNVPYMGVAGSYRYRDVELNALLKFSPWVHAEDNDEHYMRSLTFREKTHHSRYYSTAVDMGYYMTPAVMLFVGFTWNKYTIGKGSTQILDHRTGLSYSELGEVAGIQNSNYSVNTGVRYRF